MSAITERAKQSLELWDKTIGVEINVLTGMVEAEAAYYAAPELVRDMVTELERRAAIVTSRVVDKLRTKEAVRQVKRQIELYLEDGDRNRLIVALSILDLDGAQ